MRFRTHDAANRTTAFETVVQTQIGTGGRVNSRWLQAPRCGRSARVRRPFEESGLGEDGVPSAHDFWHGRLPPPGSPRGRGGNGRHTGLKILRGRPRAGSTPAVRTNWSSIANRQGGTPLRGVDGRPPRRLVPCPPKNGTGLHCSRRVIGDAGRAGFQCSSRAKELMSALDEATRSPLHMKMLRISLSSPPQLPGTRMPGRPDLCFFN